MEKTLMTNENFDMQQLMNITGQTAMNINNMSQQLGIVATAVNTLRSDVGNLTDRMNVLEQKEEITTEQKATLNHLVHKRVYDILGNNAFEIEKYSRRFISKCWTECKKYAGVGSKFEETKKENYQRAIDYIESWIPSCGCVVLKELIDKSAEARRKAKELGYN